MSLGFLAADERELDPRLALPVLHDWQPDNLVELTPEAAALHALEEKLADVRRILVHAARTPSAFKPDVKALAVAAQRLHHQVLQAALGP